MEAVRPGFLSFAFVCRSKVTSTRYKQLYRFPFFSVSLRGSYLAVCPTSKTKSLPLAGVQDIFRLGSAFSFPPTQHVYFYSAFILSKLHQGLFPGKLRSEKCLRGGKNEDTCVETLPGKHCPMTNQGKSCDVFFCSF